MALLNIQATTKNDDYFTPKEAWEDIKDYIPKNKQIWEAFYNKNSKSALYLEQLGFYVISEDIDFFKNNKGDIVVSNPPFTKKKEVLERLVELDKPFILLMPCSTLATQYTRKIFKDKTLQIIVPKKRIQFYNEKGEQVKRCAFDCLYFCYKMNLEKDIIFT